MTTHLRLLTVLVPALTLGAAEGQAPVVDPLTDAQPAPVVATVPGGAIAPVYNSDQSNLDLRLIFSPLASSITRIRDEELDSQDDQTDGRGNSLALHLVYLRASPGGPGFAVGGGLFAHTHTGKPWAVDYPESRVNAVGVDIHAAFVYRPTRRNWHFELPAVVLSGGVAKAETEGEPDSSLGLYGQISIQAGAYYTFNSGLQLGANMVLSWFKARVEQEVSTGVEHEFTFAGERLYPNLSVGYRF